MGISVIKDNDGRHYYRISRTWGNLHHQTYIPFGDDPDKANNAAKRLDRGLARKQQAYLSKWRNSYLSLQKANGHIKHLGYRVVKRKGRAPAPELRVRLPANKSHGEFQKTFSITEYGFDKAYCLALDLYLEHYQYNDKEGARSFLLEAKKYYLTDYSSSIADIVPLFTTQPIPLPDYTENETTEIRLQA